MLFGNSNILKIGLLFFFGYITVNAQNLENEIYQAIDEFSVTKTEESLKRLIQKEELFENKVVTKEEKLALVILLCNKAFYLKSVNKPAIVPYEKAWKLFSKNKLSKYNIIEYCLKPLGNLYIKNKDYTNAENIIKHYIFLAERNKNVNHQIGGMINLSILYQSIGNHKKVVEITDALLLKERISNLQKEKAKNIKAHSLLFLEENSKSVTQNKNYYKYKQFLKSKDYKKAFYYLDGFIKNSRIRKLSNRREIVRQNLEKAQLLFLLNDTVNSQKILREGLKKLLVNKELKKDNLYADPFFIDSFDLLAELKSNATEKLKYYDLAFYVSRLLVEKVTSQQAKLIHQNDNRKRSEKCIEVLFRLYEKTKEKKYFETALQYAETYKSGVVFEKMQRQKLLRKYPKDSLLLLEKELLIQQEKQTNSLVLEQTKLNSKASKISELSRQLNQISIELKTIQSKVDKKYQREISHNISLEEVLNKLDNNIVLVNYFYGKNAIYQFIVSQHDIKFNRIKLTNKIKDEIINFIRFFDDASIINNNIQKYVEEAYKIYKKLNFNMLKHQKNILIVPDGLLNFVPFEAMVTSKTSNLMYAKIPFLVKKSQVVYSVNISSFLQQKHNSKKDNVLGFFPVFSNTNKELKYSLNESKAINRFKKVKTLLKSKATKQSFIDFSNDYDILHLSTHAKGGNFYEVPTIDFVDETLTLNELYTLNLNSQLAILSACETGVGVSTKGEGVLSISRGFQYAGVPNVLFSLWSINDKSTAVLMNFFYKELKRSNSINFANQQSKRLYLQDKNIKNSKKSPYYWGAFVYYGTFEEIEKSSSSNYWLLGLVVLLIILLLYLKRR